MRIRIRATACQTKFSLRRLSRAKGSEKSRFCSFDSSFFVCSFRNGNNNNNLNQKTRNFLPFLRLSTIRLVSVQLRLSKFQATSLVSCRNELANSSNSLKESLLNWEEFNWTEYLHWTSSSTNVDWFIVWCTPTQVRFLPFIARFISLSFSFDCVIRWLVLPELVVAGCWEFGKKELVWALRVVGCRL